MPVVSAPAAEGGEATCQNEAQGYSVSYPADWIVVPGDPDQDIPACHYFGPGPFDVDAWDGEGDSPTVDIGVFAGACLEFDLIMFPVALEEVIVGGYPAFRARSARGGYAYILNLRRDDGRVLVEPDDPTPPSSEECRAARGLMIAGRDWGAIHGPPLERVVDRMTTTIEIHDN